MQEDKIGYKGSRIDSNQEMLYEAEVEDQISPLPPIMF